MFGYKAQGYYYKQLSRYYDFFDKAKIKILFFEDLKHDPKALVNQVFAFFVIDTDFTPDVEKIMNPSGKPKHPRLLNLFWRRTITNTVFVTSSPY